METTQKALEKVTQIGTKTSLRYAVQLLSLAAQNTEAADREQVTEKDAARVNDLLMDINEATQHLKKYEEKMMYH